MAKTRQQTFTIPVTGIGRVDYSQEVQKTAEAIPYSWQESYQDFYTFNLLAGASATIAVDVDVLKVIILHDFYLSCYPASDISLEIDGHIITNLAAFSPALIKLGYQFIEARIDKGINFANVGQSPAYQFVATNLGMAPIDCYYLAYGIIVPIAQLEGV